MVKLRQLKIWNYYNYGFNIQTCTLLEGPSNSIYNENQNTPSPQNKYENNCKQ